MAKVKKKKMSYAKKKALTGFIFIVPWIFGFIFFFFRPMIQSLIYSFNDVEIDAGKLILNYVGIKNYKTAFLVEPEYVRALTTSLKNVLLQVPLITVFSLFMGVILNQKFKGRVVVRAIFFLPVIIASGIVIEILSSDSYNNMIMNGDKTSLMFEAVTLKIMLEKIGLKSDTIKFIVDNVNDIFKLSWRSGIQIIIFLAGLQGIPNHLYEVCDIEGATKWETFWKVTFPLLSPITLTNVIYTIIDVFMDYSNPAMKIVSDAASKLNIQNAATMAWVNFSVIFIIIIIVYKIINKHVFYMVE